jgi:CheY-like chemotaxis protein
MPEGARSPPAFRILAVDADPALRELLAEWLAPCGKIVASPAEDVGNAGHGPAIVGAGCAHAIVDAGDVDRPGTCRRRAPAGARAR